MEKSELRQLIREEIKRVMIKEDYADDLAKKLVKSKKVKSGMNEKDKLSAAGAQMKKDLGDKRAKNWWTTYPDFAADFLSAVSSNLSESSVNESEYKLDGKLIKRLKMPILQT